MAVLAECDQFRSDMHGPNDDSNVEEESVEQPKRASLVGLPAELRLSIYRELFRIRSWEAHKGRVTDFTAPKRTLSDQCPICQGILNDGDYLYPPSRFLAQDGELYQAPLCYEAASPYERRNRCAILRACRTIYAEAADCFYANTPIMIYLGKKDYVGPGEPRLGLANMEGRESEFKVDLSLSRIQNLHLRIDFRGPNAWLALQISETMSAVWRGREHTKFHLQLQNHEDSVIRKVLLTTTLNAPSRPPLRMVLYGIALVLSSYQRYWYLFALENALPICLVEQVDYVGWIGEPKDDARYIPHSKMLDRLSSRYVLGSDEDKGLIEEPRKHADRSADLNEFFAAIQKAQERHEPETKQV